MSTFSPVQRTLAAVSVAAAIAIVLGFTVNQGITPKPRASAPTTTSPTVVPATASKRCPLTDLPARRGVPNRPALAVKVGNEPEGARPQSGLNEADIVFDTPAEGFIMRYIAVFQCKNASSIGPTRSVRWVDWHLVRQFAHPILAFAGGINPNVDQVMGFNWMRPANLLEGGQSAGQRISSRSPPDNLYTSTTALFGLFPKSNRPPKPVFKFSTKVPAGAVPASSLSINFSYGTDVVWKWDPSTSSWLHTYSGVPDIDALTGKQVSAKNVIVLIVDYHTGPYIESRGGSGDVESQTIGRGSGYVLRNGRSIKVTWQRKYLVSPFSFSRAKGEVVSLTPGRTWVEIVPIGTLVALGS